MKTACGLPNVAWVGASLFAAFSVAACSGTTEPQLGFGQNSGGGGWAPGSKLVANSLLGAL